MAGNLRRPRILRHDEEGGLQGTALLNKFAGKEIQLPTVSVEAHWQLGVAERVVKTTMDIANKLVEEQGCEEECEFTQHSK